MGEWNDPVPDAEIINGQWLDYLAKYLYENYETDPHPMRDYDPRNTYIGAVEPWESAGKRMREKWLQAAQDLMTHAGKALLGVDVNALVV